MLIIFFNYLFILLLFIVVIIIIIIFIIVIGIYSATEGADSRPVSASGTPTDEQAGQIGNGKSIKILILNCFKVFVLIYN